MQFSLLRYLYIAKSLLRTPTYLLLLLYLLVGFFAGCGLQKPILGDLGNLIVAAVLIAAWYINGGALNDYVDYEIDLINVKHDTDRPLVSGLASKRDLKVIAVTTSIICLALALLFSWQVVSAVAGLLVLNAAYSLRPLQISRRGGLAPLLLPVGYVGLPFLLGFQQHAAFSGFTAWLFAAFYLHFLGRIILKDYRDVTGDKAHGKLTFLLRHGSQMVCLLSAAAVTSSAGLLIGPLAAPMGLFRIAIVGLLCFGLGILWQLAQCNTWHQQKPLIAAFGRSMSGITAAVIIAFMVRIWPVSTIKTAMVVVSVMTIYLWSAYQAFAYNAANIRS